MGFDPPDDEIIEAPGPDDAAHAGAGEGPGTDVAEAIWALWSEVARLRQTVDEQRRERGGAQSGAAALALEAVTALRRDLEGLGRSEEGDKVTFPYALLAVPGQLQQLRAELTEDRTEWLRREAVVPNAVRAEVGKLYGELVEERSQQGAREAALAEAVRREVQRLRDDLLEDRRQGGQGQEAPSLPKVIRAALDELRFQLAEERSQREARDASIAPAMQAVHEQVAEMRAAIEAGRAEAERREAEAGAAAAAAATATVAEALERFRGELGADREARERREVALPAAAAAVTAAIETLQRELADDRRDRATNDAELAAGTAALGRALADDRGEREARDAALVGAVQSLRDDLVSVLLDKESREIAASTAMQALAGDVQSLRAELGEARLDQRTLVASAADLIRTHLAEVQADLAQDRARNAAVGETVARVAEDFAALRAQLDADRRQQEALAFQLPEANQEIQGQLAEVRTEHAAGLKQLEEMLRATVGGANSWFVRTRDEIVAKIDQIEAAARARERPPDFGITEAMVGVLEHLRSEVHDLQEAFSTASAALHGLAGELATLSQRPHLTPANVRKIVKEVRSEAVEVKAANGNGRAPKPAKKAASRPRRSGPAA